MSKTETQSEREMLEAAARAAGVEPALIDQDGEIEGYDVNGDSIVLKGWNPRADDGDAFRLAAALRISVEHSHPEQEHNPWVLATIEGPTGVIQVMEDVPDESQRADRMRLAILRCAAAQAPKEVA